ncbi:MAG: cobalamin-dependent protein [Coriobacteriia bacterium]|nr:cobalamin-dependent protein [Coriobacteriia bacterium]
MGAGPQKVALIRPLHTGEEFEFQEPLAIEYLAGALRQAGAGHEVALFDRRLYERRGQLPAFRDDFTAQEPFDTVGFSLMTAEDLPDTLRLIQRMKLAEPAPRFVLGGLFITLAGERLHELVPSEVTLIPGEGEAPLTGSPAWAPAWRPQLADYLAQGCAINLRGARGCSGTCAFCATPALPQGLSSWAGRAIPELADEIAALTAEVATLGADPVFNFVEDDFGPLARVEELDAELRVRGLRVAYSMQLRGAALLAEPDVAARMARLHEGGLCRLFIGVESMTPATLRAWHKPLDPVALLALLRQIEQAGVRVHIGYILWHKDSTPQSVRHEAAALHEQGFFSLKCLFNRMVLFPGSALAATAAAESGRTQSGGAGVSRTTWQALSPACEALYEKLTSWLRPLYLVWVRAATDLPLAASRAWLSGDGHQASCLDEALSTCDRVAYAAVADGDFSTDVTTLAAKLMEDLDEVHCPRT